ncbi:myeloid differentiation primary response protein MyD88 [Belonocnema kinseyi]|uniref:myeloid differentiation primary response protein MyD88 n=1 Tax=Belonocnema kinseyi TaxID=2817044 RepID=UPI00143D80C3|nr:myeloid differentiation primary response protein MyD88 [Belonocnema kinseyi]
MDFSTVPLFALSTESKQLISTLLNPPKILKSDNGWPRDWRGLAYVLGIPGEKIPLLESQRDPADKLLGTLQEKSNSKITFKELQDAFDKIDRWDVIDDLEPLFVKDAQAYFERIERSKLTPESIDNNVDAAMLTVDDIYRFKDGSERQFYDAFLLYADEEFEFAKEVLERLEKDNLKLCTRERDLIGGITFEHDAIMQLISERCNRLIAIISPDFLKSPANQFFLKYAHAVQIETRQRKLIPFIYKTCELPRVLSFTNKADYSRRDNYDFWGKLRDSIRAPLPPDYKTDKIVPSTCRNPSLEKAAPKINSESCYMNDMKKTILSVGESVSEKNEFLKVHEKLQKVEGEPELAKGTRISLKNSVSLFNFTFANFKKKVKKADESPEEINKELIRVKDEKKEKKNVKKRMKALKA